MRGRKPLPIRTCKECALPIIFLANRKTGRGIPVNPETLSERDRDLITLSGRSMDVDFDMTRHQLHKLQCRPRSETFGDRK